LQRAFGAVAGPRGVLVDADLYLVSVRTADFGACKVARSFRWQLYSDAGIRRGISHLRGCAKLALLVALPIGKLMQIVKLALAR